MPELNEKTLGVEEPVLVPIDRVKPYPQNTKIHSMPQVRKIATSISNYGWDQPIVVDNDMVIIKGHGRLRAAEHLGLKEVPVVVNKTLDEDQVRAARIMDNKSAEAEWDKDKLWDELSGLKESGVDLKDVGFEEKSLNKMFPEFAEPGTKASGVKPDKEIPEDSSGAGSDGYAKDPTVPLEQGFIDYFKGEDAWLRKLSLVDYFNYHDKIVVGYSGGKDSLAGLIWVLENCDNDKVFVYYTNPGWGCDWPHSLEYIKVTEKELGIRVWMAGPSDPAVLGGFEDNLLQVGFPGYGGGCWIEGRVKIPRANALLRQEGLIGRESGLKVVQLIGIRWEESPNRAKIYPDRGILKDNGNHYGNPVLQWTGADIGYYLDERGLKLHTAYEGENRMGCLMCPKGSPSGAITIRKKFPNHWKRVLEFYALGSRGAESKGNRKIPEHFSKWLLKCGDTKVKEQRFRGDYAEISMSTTELEDKIEELTGEKLPRPYLTENFDITKHKGRDDLKNVVFRDGKAEHISVTDC